MKAKTKENKLKKFIKLLERDWSFKEDDNNIGVDFGFEKGDIYIGVNEWKELKEKWKEKEKCRSKLSTKKN